MGVTTEVNLEIGLDGMSGNTAERSLLFNKQTFGFYGLLPSLQDLVEIRAI